ncbi:MAG: Rieske 2Fe-2S domain-containing protein [Bacteroidetes bacterium]|nr:Rieske 2Fe-2S domain-containing protein [Bacteroidota bacterium]
MDTKAPIPWIKIASKREELPFGDNKIALIHFEEKKICIIDGPDGLHACIDTCPHASGQLSGGFIDGKGNIVCPVHHYAFNLFHGRDTQQEGYKLKVFDIKENEEGIFLNIS